MEREKKKRVDDNTWRERKGRSKKREREESANTHRLAAVYTQLALPRVLHQLTSSSFWSSQATRIPQQLETLPTTTTITTTTRSRCPPPLPLSLQRERSSSWIWKSRGCRTIKSNDDIEGERKNGEGNCLVIQNHLQICAYRYARSLSCFCSCFPLRCTCV